VKHARYCWQLLAEGHLNRRQFGAMLGPDRAATATDGIESYWVKSAAASGRQQVGGRRGVAKVAEYRAISEMLVRIAYRFGSLQMKIITQCRERARWVYTHRGF
jgi:hypothetical protein